MTKQNENFASVMDEAYAEHQAEKQAAEAKEKAEHEAKRMAALEADRAARRKQNEQNSVHLHKIARWIGMDRCKVIDEEFKLIVDGIDCQYWYSLEQRYERGSRYSFRQTKCIGMKMTVGSFGNRKSFPQKKNGTFSYDKIANELEYRVKGELTRMRLTKQKGANQTFAARVVNKLFSKDNGQYQSVIRASQDAKKPIFFEFKVSQAMTEAQALELAAAIRKCGIQLHYGDKPCAFCGKPCNEIRCDSCGAGI